MTNSITGMKPNERQRWMAAYEAAVLELAPQLAGKIDWTTAIYFFNQRYSATHAAERYVTSFERNGSGA